MHTYTVVGTFTATETVTDSAGKTASKSAQVLFQGVPALLDNGGFEAGTSSWTAGTGVICTNATCSGETARQGTGFAWLDGYGAAHTDTLSQTISLQTAMKTASLQFYLHVDTKETSTTTAYDKLVVSVTSGGTTTTLGTFSNLNHASGYQLKSLNLTPWLGKTVTIKFTGTEDASAADLVRDRRRLDRLVSASSGAGAFRPASRASAPRCPRTPGPG